MRYIRKLSIRYKSWKDKNDRKKFRYECKRKNRRKRKVVGTVKERTALIPTKQFNVPVCFSIIRNPEETVKFLNDMIADVENVRKIVKRNSKKPHYTRLFFINMDNTKEITSDALMYLLTIIKNTRGNKLLPINWTGNFPSDEKMKAFLQNSGYLRYMKTSKENLVQTNENIQIQMGQGYEYRDNGKIIDIRQEIIDFTCQKLNKNKVEVNFLMTMLTEMITNIKDHAYDNENIFEHSWYIFVENNSNKITYTFMDNGLGIPTTIKKSSFEKLIQKLDIDKEYKYIEAGVSGIQKRSKTGKIERGNGLPSIYEQYTENKISKLIIISNSAYYTQEKPRDLRNNLSGTVFYWEIEKEENI